MRVAGSERVQRLRGKSIEEWIDRIGVGGLQTGVGLKAEPGGVVLVDVVVDARRLHLLVIIAGVRNALAIGAAIAVWGLPEAALHPTSNGQPRTASGVPVVLP